MRWTALLAVLATACASDRAGSGTARPDADATAAIDGGGADAAEDRSSATDANTDADADATDTDANTDATDADATDDPWGASDAAIPSVCDDVLDGTLIAIAPDAVGYGGIKHAVGTSAGAYFSGWAQVCVSSQGCSTIAGLYFGDGTATTPATVVDGVMDQFAIVGGHAWYFDPAYALVVVDLATGDKHATGIVGSEWSGHWLTSDAAALYWTVDDTASHLLRAAVAPDGSLGPPQEVRVSAQDIGSMAAGAGGLGWLEGRSAMALPAGATTPQAWFSDDWPDAYWHLAGSDSELLLLDNHWGPQKPDGFAGPFLGARLYGRGIASGPTELIRSTPMQINQVAATPDALLWVDTFEVPGNGGCSRLWRQPWSGGAPQLIASGRYAAYEGGIAPYGETVYWWADAGVYRFDP